MSKEEIIKTIEDIDEQLKQNKEVIEACTYVDANVLTLCEISKLLIDSREMWQNILLNYYGVYYMRGL